MNYSKALISDFENIKCIRINTHKMHYDNEPKFFKEEDNFFTFEFFKEKIEKGQIFTLTINQELVGYIIINEVIFENNPMMKDQRILLVEEITVKDKHQNKGYGKELMKRIEEYARENKYTSIELNVWGFNDNAIKFYKKLGMKVSRIKMEKRF